MYSNFKEQAIEYAKQAVHEDNAGNYNKAFPLYMNALEYFKTHLKYENNPKIREAITQKFTEYLRRAEEILVVLDEGESGPGSSGDTAVATKPKTKPKDGDGGGKDGEDPEQSKLRAGLNSTIVREKFNIKWSDVAGQISSSNSSSNSYNNESRPVCQICGKVGHTALKCWHRFDNSYQPDEAAQALAAMHITDVTERRGQEWYPGASAHVTNSAQHLQRSQPYKGNKETADSGKKP